MQHKAKVNLQLLACVCQCSTRLYDVMQPMKQKTLKQKELFQCVQDLCTYCHSKSHVCIGRVLGMWSGSSEWLKVGDDEVMKASARGLNVKSFSSVAFLKGNYAWEVETVLWHTTWLSCTTFIMNSRVYALTVNSCLRIMWIRDKWADFRFNDVTAALQMSGLCWKLIA